MELQAHPPLGEQALEQRPDGEVSKQRGAQQQQHSSITSGGAAGSCSGGLADSLGVLGVADGVAALLLGAFGGLTF